VNSASLPVDAPLLRCSGVSKLYARRTQTRRSRLAEIAWPALFGLPIKEMSGPRANEFWAVSDVNFELRKGEALGVIGLNGSGKTTLLRMLAGQILPDRGEIVINGTSAAMIDLQAGFQPPASGRQNIFLRGAALGFTREQTREKLEEIIEFSELGDAIDAPMASYSSGMKMRLAFSVMAIVAPNVLFIDEVLAVGDFKFRQKCLSKVREMRARSAFVLVSHSMGEISRFCDQAIVLKSGCVDFHGAPSEAIAHYMQVQSDQAAPKKKTIAPDNNGAGKGEASSLPPIIPETVDRPELLDRFEFSWIGSDGEAGGKILEGRPFAIEMSFYIHYAPRNLVVGVPVYDMDGNVISAFSTDAEAGKIEAGVSDRITVRFDIPDASFNPGKHRAAVGITDGTEFLLMKELPELVIEPTGRKSWGRVSIPYTMSVRASESID